MYDLKIIQNSQRNNFNTVPLNTHNSRKLLIAKNVMLDNKTSWAHATTVATICHHFEGRKQLLPVA